MALDPSQLHAATSTASIQLVLAGPGSGKTSTLVGRYVHLVKQGVDPRRILAVTFTRKATEEMRTRVWAACGRSLRLTYPTLSDRDLPIATFHAFALAELKRDADAAGGELGFSGLRTGFKYLTTRREQRAIFQRREMWWRETGDILDIIGNAKERLLDAQTFEDEIMADPQRSGDRTWLEAIRYFQVYQQQLRSDGAVDFADFVPRVVAMMDIHPSAREAITGRFDHLLVDEYQDLNPGQHLLVDRFVEDGVKLWAVGDDDQTLFSFRSSDVRLILGFEQHYRSAWDRWNLAPSQAAEAGRLPLGDAPEVVVHRLDRNYRSHAAIVSLGQRLIGNNTHRMVKPLQPHRPDIVANDPINRVAIFGYATPEEEARQIAKAVKALLARGVVPDEIAILYRLSALSHHLAVALVAADVPFTVRGGGDLWQSAPARLLRGGLLYALLGETPQVMSVMGASNRGQSLRKAIDGRRIESYRSAETNRAQPTREVLGEYPHRRVRAPLDFKAAFHTVHGLVSDMFPSAKSAQKGDPDDAAAFDAAAAFIETFGSIEAMEKGVADLSRALEDKPKDVVVLSTIHKAKGLEWDFVFLVGCEDGIMPHIRATREVKNAREARSRAPAALRVQNPYTPALVSTPSPALPEATLKPGPAEEMARLMVEEERRIAFVGLTRARLGITITHVRKRNNDQSRPSPFLREMLGGLVYGRSLAAVADPRKGGPRDPEILVKQPVFRAADGTGPDLPVPMTRSMVMAGRDPALARDRIREPAAPAGYGSAPRRAAGGAPLF